eukprot:119034-Prorocentrum_minimum.AAC.1
MLNALGSLKIRTDDIYEKDEFVTRILDRCVALPSTADAPSATRIVDPHRRPASSTRIVDPHRQPASSTRIVNPHRQPASASASQQKYCEGCSSGESRRTAARTPQLRGVRSCSKRSPFVFQAESLRVPSGVHSAGPSDH